MHFDIPLRTRLSVALISILAALCCPIYASAATPWTHNANLQWHRVTGLPVITNTGGLYTYWDFNERQSEGTPRLFAQVITYGNEQRLCVANASTTPIFSEVSVNW